MSGTVDIRRVLLAVMAAATLAVVLAVPMHANAAGDCSAAGTDPTAAQYCPPTEPVTEAGEGSPTEPVTEAGEGPTTEPVAEAGEEESSVASSATESPPSEGGSLPFTGSDVLALLAVAAAFIAVGLALQRLSRTGTDRS